MNNRIFGVPLSWATVALGDVFCTVAKREFWRGRISVAGVGVVAFFSRHHQAWVIVNCKEIKELVGLASDVSNKIVNRSDSSASRLWMILELSEVAFRVHRQRRHLERAAKKAKRSVAKHSLLMVGLEEDFVDKLCKIKDDKLAYLAMLAFDDATKLLRQSYRSEETTEEDSYLCLTGGRLNAFGLKYLTALFAFIENTFEQRFDNSNRMATFLPAYGLGKLVEYVDSEKDFSAMLTALRFLLDYFGSHSGEVVELEVGQKVASV